MPENLEVRQAQGIVFPPHKRHTFHRINLEYLVPLRGVGQRDVYHLLDAGIRHNLHKAGGDAEVLHGLRPQLEVQAAQLSTTGHWLVQGRGHLRKQLLQGSFVGYRAGLEAEFASKKLSESLAVQGADAQQRIMLAEHMLCDALTVNAHDYRAHFELGWVYLFMLNKLADAEFHFQMAVAQARTCDPAFALFAERHLADARYSGGNYGGAVETALSVLHHAPHPDFEHRYECSRYLAAHGEQRSAAETLAGVVAQSSAYYVQAQAEPDFVGSADVAGVLHDLRAVKVKRIQHYVRHNWQRHSLSTFPLPDQIDQTSLHKQVCKQHVRVMTHLPYSTLSLREKQIGDLILDASQKRILREVKQRSHHYERVADHQRTRWSWVNSLGGGLIHLSVILLLAALIFQLLRVAAAPLGWGLLLGADSLVNQILNWMLVAGVAGVVLFQFVPFGVKKLLRKQVELDNTLSLLQALN